ncbi:aminotransferase class III-fold pyridoxal phosphate-dependent enzyme [Mesorhizobium sp. VK4C]|uniref:aminotransferase class III-fold pyridoxal phosphate-dependent enzyme n=1 Tax=Mesorhizobium captivum TaxID=3072319 RepID=UPI002A23F8A6|nr:aminotransferase class III-fold pyridoxal phosphate-dependent enzyme [Mesorhizobium sp. VK4C]MDX8502598.1 aminotransferase class III-fold pyridoxal phosphate-dependent enzyme [Mesorhizobium sp. VK4C]
MESCQVNNATKSSRLSTSRVIRPWSVQGSGTPQRIARGEGPWFITSDGKRILDFASGWATTSLGHSHQAISEAIREQLDRIAWAPPNFALDIRDEYAEALSRLAPWVEGCRSWFVTGGGQANEDAVTIARLLTGRHKVLTAYRSFHGNTVASSALTGSSRRWATEAWQPGGTVRFWAPNPYRSPFHTDDPALEVTRALAHLDEVVAAEKFDSIAAILLEPVVGSEGLIVYPDGYLAGVQALAEKAGIILIFDEVITGFGRVGAPFAAQRIGVTPDMITFGKGCNSGAVPLGGVLIREGLARHFDSSFFPLGQTYSAHPLGMASGLAALNVCLAEDLYTRGVEIECWIREAMEVLVQRHSIVGHVRGLGAMWGMELVSDRATREPLVSWHSPNQSIVARFFDELLQDGLLMHGKYSIPQVLPPLTISRSDVEVGFEMLDRALTRLNNQLGVLP